ncbi:hypothetical protein F5884DRAFT_858894 [Xylogone sp. PMI_703]|nr:hypothetical protein F5884DRAFT_858894 [Xylogone sp. PMI_703]
MSIMTTAIASKRPTRAAIKELDERVASHQKFSFTSEDLQCLSIKKLLVSFEGKDGELNPAFFAPYLQGMEPPKDKWVGIEYPTYDAEESKRFSMIHIEHADEICNYLSAYLVGYQDPTSNDKYRTIKSSWAYQDTIDFRFKSPLFEDGHTPQTNEKGSKCPPRWVLKSIRFWANEPAPHLKCMMRSDVEGKDDLLYRAELLALIRIIKGRLHTSVFAGHDVHPVLLISCMGIQHARIIQAHFTGTELIVQYSRLYDMREPNDATLLLLARWYIGPPLLVAKEE